MPVEPPLNADRIIRTVAAVRPPVPEDALSPQGMRAQAIRARVLASATPATPATPGDAASPAPSRARRVRRRWARPAWALPRVGLALAIPVAVVIALVLSGTFEGPDDSGTQPAAAAVIRDAAAALAPAGTILIEDETYVSGPSVHGHPYHFDQIQETPSGPGPQNVLTITDKPGAAGRSKMTAWEYVGGTEAFYVASTNTIYASSIWGPYLHPGPRPGTYVYRDTRGATAYTNHPIMVTADQRRLLLSGVDAIRGVGRTVKGKYVSLGLRVKPALRGPGYAQVIREQLKNHLLHYVGRTTVDGRPALELAGTGNGEKSGDERIYLDPATHLPFEEIDRPGTSQQQVIRVSLRRLPITPADERLLSLPARYPSARIDRDHSDYLRAARGIEIYTQ